MSALLAMVDAHMTVPTTLVFHMSVAAFMDTNYMRMGNLVLVI